MTARKKRILKKEWKESVNRFNSRHRFKKGEIQSGDDPIMTDVIIAGIKYDEDARTVDIMVCSDDPDSPCIMAGRIEVPRGIFEIYDENEVFTGIQIQGKPGIPMLRIMLAENGANERENLIRKIAHKLYERRNPADGSPESDWIQAERIIDSAISSIT